MRNKKTFLVIGLILLGLLVAVILYDVMNNNSKSSDSKSSEISEEISSEDNFSSDEEEEEIIPTENEENEVSSEGESKAPVAKTFVATFKKNGAASIGKSSLKCETKEESCIVKAPTITRSNAEIVGWSTSTKGTNIVKVGDDIVLTKNTTYYAITTVKESPSSASDNTSSSSPSDNTSSSSKTESSTVSFKFDSSAYTVEVGKSLTIKASITPSSEYKNVKWSVSNDSLVSNIKSGETGDKATLELTGKTAGTVTVTISTKDGKYSASVKVTIKTAPTNPSVTGFAAEVVKLVNAERAKEGLDPLSSSNSSLNNAANTRAKELVALFSHTRPNGSNCFTAFKEAGVSYSAAGENIAKGQKTPAAVVNSWMNSEGHRKNILSTNFKTIAVGAYAENGTIHWVQLFIG